MNLQIKFKKTGSDTKERGQVLHFTLMSNVRPDPHDSYPWYN